MWRNKAVHFFRGCYKTKQGESFYLVPVTRELKEVTCCKCIDLILKRKLKPRTDFSEVPIFEVVSKKRKNGMGTCDLVFNCPCCGKKNFHSGEQGNVGAADGHRISHCSCWVDGYYIREVQK